jgi:hypothetical protein
MRRISALSVFLTLAICGCGKSSEKTISVKDPQTGKKVDVTVNNVDKGNITLKTGQGSLVINSGESAKTPAGIDAYPGAKIQSSITGFGVDQGKSNSGSMLAMTTPDEPAKVLAYYRSKFASKGWKIKMETTTSEEGMISAGADEATAGALVTASRVSGETIVSVMIGK